MDGEPDDNGRPMNQSENDIIALELTFDPPKLTVSGKGWTKEISLPNDGPWYPHFVTYGSFELVDENSLSC